MEIWDVYDRDKKLTGKHRVRGTELGQGEYHLVSIIWLKGKDGRFLIAKRNKLKLGGGLWETTGGSAVQGENSLDTAVREVGEEIGLKLSPSDFSFLKSVRHDQHSGWFADYWCVETDIEIGDVTCQKEEVECVKWATRDEILCLIKDGLFFHGGYHLESLFNTSIL